MYHLLSLLTGGPVSKRNKKGKASAVRHKRLANAIFSERPAHTIVCPRCKTAQDKSQDACYACGAMFIFLSETNRYC